MKKPWKIVIKRLENVAEAKGNDLETEEGDIIALHGGLSVSPTSASEQAVKAVETPSSTGERPAEPLTPTAPEAPEPPIPTDKTAPEPVETKDPSKQSRNVEAVKRGDRIVLHNGLPVSPTPAIKTAGKAVKKRTSAGETAAEPAELPTPTDKIPPEAAEPPTPVDRAAVKAVETKELVKRYENVEAVKGINLEIEEGELFGLLGPNGAGKTTTISMLCTIVRPTSGSARIYGHDVKREPGIVRGLIGIVFQDPSLDDNLTGRENLDFHGQLYKVPRGEIGERITGVLELVELSDKADTIVKKYSGGMKRRLEIARGLLHHPKVLFLDEPTLGLDPQTRRHIWEYIEKLNREQRITMILTTHYMDEADKLCDRIAIIDHGTIVAIDTPDNLRHDVGGDVVIMTVPEGGDMLKMKLEKLEVVKSAQLIDGVLRLSVDKGETVIPIFMDAAREAGITVSSISLQEPTLEDIFIMYTGREIRAQEAPGGLAAFHGPGRR
jgi:ABC-2 type transport system ATP-binding protein